MVSTPCPMVYSQVPSPTLIRDSVLDVLIFKERYIDLHVASSLPVTSAMMGMLGAFGPVRL